jgi:hypothetical protein
MLYFYLEFLQYFNDFFTAPGSRWRLRFCDRRTAFSKVKRPLRNRFEAKQLKNYDGSRTSHLAAVLGMGMFFHAV